MKLNKEGYDLITKFEGLKLKPYQDSKGIWTIGIGSTFYPNGVRVTKYDAIITKEYAIEMFKIIADRFAKQIDNIVKNLNQNQFNSIVSLTYNVGIENLKTSTLLKKILKDPNDKTIASEFLKWNHSGGKIIEGLTKRRKEESDLYFKK